MNDIFNFLISDRFLFWGFTIFYIILPFIFFILLCIFHLFVDYSEFKEYKKEKFIDERIRILKNDLDVLEKQKKEKTK